MSRTFFIGAVQISITEAEPQKHVLRPCARAYADLSMTSSVICSVDRVCMRIRFHLIVYLLVSASLISCYSVELLLLTLPIVPYKKSIGKRTPNRICKGKPIGSIHGVSISSYAPWALYDVALNPPLDSPDQEPDLYKV